MIEQLLELVKGVWAEVKLVELLESYKAGLVWRNGRIHRRMKTGWNWKFPVIEVFHSVTTQDDTKQLRSQTIGDKTVIPNVCYYVQDVGRYWQYVCSSGDSDSIVDDVVAAVVAEGIRKNQEIKTMKRKVKRKLKHYGMNLRSLTFSTDSQTPAIRLIIDKELTE